MHVIWWCHGVLVMASEVSPRVPVRWQGNQSKQYDNTEEVPLTSIIAINDSPVINPTLDQLSVGNYIEREYLYKCGRVQIWKGVV